MLGGVTVHGVNYLRWRATMMDTRVISLISCHHFVRTVQCHLNRPRLRACDTTLHVVVFDFLYAMQYRIDCYRLVSDQ